jgi:hypothetical protein
MKFAKTFFWICLCFAISSTALSKSNNNAESTVSMIQNDLDSLISHLNQQKLAPIQMSKDEQKDFLNKGQKVNLKDEILNAFEDLNNDFQQYQEILGTEPQPSNHTLPIKQIEAHLNKTMSIINFY